LDNIHTQRKATTPYAGRVNNIQAKGKMMTTTTGLHMENDTQTLRPLQSKKSKEGDNELYHLDKWMMPLAEV
jgi:hypothetical protein